LEIKALQTTTGAAFKIFRQASLKKRKKDALIHLLSLCLRRFLGAGRKNLQKIIQIFLGLCCF
jgi:hypothetical protein